MNKLLLIGILIVVAVLITLLLLWPTEKEEGIVIEKLIVEEPVVESVIEEPQTIESSCVITEIIFYHSEHCGFCKQVWNDGSVEVLTELGVNVDVRDVNKDSIDHSFEGVPTFVVEGEVLTGYRNTDQLKELLECK